MATELTEVKSFVTQELLNRISAYKQTYNFQSLSQAVTAALTEFFNTCSEQIFLEQANNDLAQKIGKLEETVLDVVNRLVYLEEKSIASKQNTNSYNFRLNDLSSVDIEQQIESSSINDIEIGKSCLIQLKQSELYSKSGGKIYSSEKAQTEFEIKDVELNRKESIYDQLDRTDLEQGIGGSMLARRLKTNPSTLRKYLRDQRQVQWAAERDPDKLGWTYDPLLQRYYPTPVDCDRSQVISLAATKTIPNEEHSPCAFVEAKSDTEPEKPERIASCSDTGLTQAQLSRLSGIPTNTLQRWKHLVDCAERIQKRSRGKFLYWYCKEHEIFHPLLK